VPGQRAAHGAVGVQGIDQLDLAGAWLIGWFRRATRPHRQAQVVRVAQHGLPRGAELAADLVGGEAVVDVQLAQDAGRDGPAVLAGPVAPGAGVDAVAAQPGADRPLGDVQDYRDLPGGKAVLEVEVLQQLTQRGRVPGAALGPRPARAARAQRYAGPVQPPGDPLPVHAGDPPDGVGGQLFTQVQVGELAGQCGGHRATAKFRAYPAPLRRPRP
jgi:hypothetical protein